jgi:uncharacterized membrane protein
MLDILLPGLSSAHNLHPMVVHFPIVLWVLAFGTWCLALARRQDLTWRLGTWFQTLALMSALVALAMGYIAADRLGHDSPGHDLVHVHRDYMVWTTVLSALVTLAAWLLRNKEGGWRVGLLLASLGVVVMMTLGADRGALLVFTHGTGVSEDVLRPPPQGSHGGHDHGGHDHGGHSH